MLKGAIFDLDGTILDSMFIWETVGENYLRSLGYEPKEDINALFKTFSLYQAACYYKKEYGVPLSVEELMEGVNKTVENYYFYTVPAKAGVKAFIERLSSRGVKMCVATATDRYQAEAALERLGMNGFFSKIITCIDVGHGKDEAYIYREALAHLGTSRENTPVFEDALYALETARKDGFLTVGVFDRSEKEQKKIKKISDVYLKDYLHTEKFWKLAEKI